MDDGCYSKYDISADRTQDVRLGIGFCLVIMVQILRKMAESHQ